MTHQEFTAQTCGTCGANRPPGPLIHGDERAPEGWQYRMVKKNETGGDNVYQWECPWCIRGSTKADPEAVEQPEPAVTDGAEARPYLRLNGKDFDLTEPLAVARFADELAAKYARASEALTRASEIQGEQARRIERLAKAAVVRVCALKLCNCCGAHVFDPLDEVRLEHGAGCAVGEGK